MTVKVVNLVVAEPTTDVSPLEVEWVVTRSCEKGVVARGGVQIDVGLQAFVLTAQTRHLLDMVLWLPEPTNVIEWWASGYLTIQEYLRKGQVP